MPAKRGIQKRSRKLAVLSVRSIFDYAAIIGYPGRNPGRVVKTPKTAKMNFPRSLSREEIRRLMELPPPAFDGTARKDSDRARHMRDRFALRFLLETGLRTSEFVALRLSDLHLDDRRVFIRRGKNQQARNVILSPAMVQETVTYLETIRPRLLPCPTDRLYPGTRSETPTRTADSLRGALRAYAERANVHGFHPHRLRATCARLMAEAGTDLKVIQMHLGHNDIGVTAGYIAAFSRDQEFAAQEVFGPAWWREAASNVIPLRA